MTHYSNVSSVPLSLAVFLATDHYDHNDDPNTISATTLIKPVRQIVLSARVPETEKVVDLTSMVSSRMGTAIHDGIERAWKEHHATALSALGLPKRVISQIRINPKPEELQDGIIPIYMEQRSSRKVEKYTISGKYDFVGDGRLEDFKSTSVYTAINHTNDEKYSWQGSIYRWLNPKIITQDEMAIQFIFTDWSAAKARADANYPQKRIQQRIIPLKSYQETDAFVLRKIRDIERYWHADEKDIPLCTDGDLWRTAPEFKYYKNPTKMARSTKNFETYQEAHQRFMEDGQVGVVVEKPGKVTACKYCAAFYVCTQKDTLVASGDLEI